jgi:hypothetical protein
MKFARHLVWALLAASVAHAADAPISALSPATTLSGAESLPVVQGGATVRATVNQVLAGNASTATALAANGANCPSGQAPLGVDASGAAEGCFAVQISDAALTALAAGSDFVQFTGPTSSTKVFTLPNSNSTLLSNLDLGVTVQAYDAALAAIAGGSDFVTFSGPTTSTKTFTLPDASSTILTTNAAVTVAQGGTGATTLTGVVRGNGTSAFTAGTISITSDTTGNLPVTRLNDGASASSSTYWRGDGTWATPSGSGAVSSGTGNRLAYYGTTGTTVSELAGGSDGQILTLASGVPTWTTGISIPDLTAVSQLRPADSTIVYSTADTGPREATIAEIRNFSITASAGTTATPNCNATQSNHSNTSSTGTWTVAAPTTCTPVDGQRLNLRLTSTNSQTFSWNSAYDAGTTALPTSIAAGETMYVGVIYNSTSTNWQYVATAGGF